MTKKEKISIISIEPESNKINEKNKKEHLELDFSTNFHNYVYFYSDKTKINVVLSLQCVNNCSENLFWEENKKLISSTFSKIFNYCQTLNKEPSNSLSLVQEEKTKNPNDLLILYSELANCKFSIKSPILSLDKEFEQHLAKSIMNIKIN